jgi:hypothetical protein
VRALETFLAKIRRSSSAWGGAVVVSMGNLQGLV